jgi:serine/threonine protein kinase
MSFKIPSLRRAATKRNIAQDLPCFEYEKIEEKEQIGHGAYGVVYKGRYNDEVVVEKNLHGESADEEECFIKEARLMFSLEHENVVSFKAFSSSPCAIMMENIT